MPNFWKLCCNKVVGRNLGNIIEAPQVRGFYFYIKTASGRTRHCADIGPLYMIISK